MEKMVWGIYCDDQLIGITSTKVRAESWARDLLGKNGWEVRKLTDEPCRTLAGMAEEYYGVMGENLPHADSAVLTLEHSTQLLISAHESGDRQEVRDYIGMVMLNLTAYAAAVGTDPVACMMEAVEAAHV